MSRKPRGVRGDELELWRKVASTAQPIHPERPKNAVERAIEKHAPHAPKPIPPKPRVTDFHIGEAAPGTALRHDIAPTLTDHFSRAQVHMDRKSFGKLTRGKLKPEGRLDLHGMTLAQAHPALNGFVQRAHASGKRLVLVITGKGKSREDHGPIPERRGVLKHQVPQWLAAPPLGALVLQVTPAHLKHGGTGAYYVYLRRAR